MQHEKTGTIRKFQYLHAQGRGSGAQSAPAVIFGSDDLEGCKHAVFEILSNAIDEAREGYGDTIIVTRYEDLSVEVEDFGRAAPWTTTKRKNATTGSWCSAKCTPAANMGKTGKTMSILWA